MSEIAAGSKHPNSSWLLDLSTLCDGTACAGAASVSFRGSVATPDEFTSRWFILAWTLVDLVARGVEIRRTRLSLLPARHWACPGGLEILRGVVWLGSAIGAGLVHCRSGHVVGFGSKRRVF